MAVEHLIVGHLSTKDLIRIFSKITTHPDLTYNETHCWIWCASRDKDGYGKLKYLHKNRQAHRFIFAWLVIPIPIGRKHGEIDHLCRRPSCCNPLHLEYVSARTNVLRSHGPAAKNARKTRCHKGHPLTGDNLQIMDGGRRQCHTCILERKRRWRARDGNWQRELQSPARKAWVKKWSAENREQINIRARANYRARRVKLGLPTRPGAYID